MQTCTERILIHPNSKLLRILKILQMDVEGLLVVNPSIVDKRVDLPTIAMPTCPKCRRQTLLRRWSDMYNKTDTVKANVGIHWWTIGCTPPNLHNWEPGLTQEWARSYRFARTCVKSSTTFSRVTYKPHAIHLNRAPPQDHCQEIHMQANNFHGFHPCRTVSHREKYQGVLTFLCPCCRLQCSTLEER